jgi:hypothetical protein
MDAGTIRGLGTLVVLNYDEKPADVEVPGMSKVTLAPYSIWTTRLP